MASQFLKTLPKISINNLPADCKTCIICTDEYNTTPLPSKTAENPVQLPCLHIIGANCIAKWLTERSNSCPYCRREFFPRAFPDNLLGIGDDIIGLESLDDIDIEIGDDVIGMENIEDINIDLPSFPDDLELDVREDELEEFEPRLSECLTLFLSTLGIVARPGWDEDFPEWNEDPLG